jgi:membrane associated rhomboid family serine protease
MGGGPVAHFAVAIALTYIAVEVLHQLKRLAAYKAAMILIALNVLAFCVMWAADLHGDLFRELELMSTSAWRVIWWIPLSLFVHGDLPHLTTNMLILALVSWKLEPRIERKHFVGIFLFSGVVSDVAILAFMRLNSLPILFLGASGAVLGLVAALAFVSSNRLLRLAVLGIALHYAVSRSTTVAVHSLPHFFGLLAGFVYAVVFHVSDREPT